MPSSPDAWMYLDANVGLTAPPAQDVYAYSYASVLNDAVTWPATAAASIELTALSQAQFGNAGPVWIVAIAPNPVSMVWMPDPNNPKKGYWGILMADNS